MHVSLDPLRLLGTLRPVLILVGLSLASAILSRTGLHSRCSPSPSSGRSNENCQARLPKLLALAVTVLVILGWSHRCWHPAGLGFSRTVSVSSPKTVRGPGSMFMRRVDRGPRISNRSPGGSNLNMSWLIGSCKQLGGGSMVFFINLVRRHRFSSSPCWVCSISMSRYENIERLTSRTNRNKHYCGPDRHRANSRKTMLVRRVMKRADRRRHLGRCPAGRLELGDAQGRDAFGLQLNPLSSAPWWRRIFPRSLPWLIRWSWELANPGVRCACNLLRS